MMDPRTKDSCDLLEKVRAGDEAALNVLLGRYGERLRRMIRLRIHPRVRARMDPDDVIQEVLLEGSRRLPEWLAKPVMPLFLWLRFLAFQRLSAIHRQHLGVQARDARREVRLDAPFHPGATSAALADRLVGGMTSPTQGAARREIHGRLLEGLEQMNERDREILALRHFELLTNAEAARELSLDTSTASKRYVRALMRLRAALGDLSGQLG